ncbi:MAG: FAD-dependent oxidoreductase [Schlesneria sp.]
MKYKSVGIIGAGIAGLVCADRLRREGVAVTILEKSRGVGGRSATRHLDETSCDHGAQYFTVSDSLFAERVAQWRENGVVDIWQGRIVAIDSGVIRELNETRVRLVGTPGMNSIGKHLALNLDVKNNTEIKRVERSNERWWAFDEADHTYGPFDILISTAPPIQTHQLFAEWSPQFAEQLDSIEMLPCWSAILRFASRLPVDFDGAFVNGAPLSWVARNNSKPGRGPSECWLLHGSAAWSAANVDREPEESGKALVNEFWKLFGREILLPSSVTAHRWRYSIPRDVLPTRYLLDDQLQVGCAGDWCGGPRIEGAFLSGNALAMSLLETR